MTWLTDLQLADVCRRTGWPANLVPTAVAMALAASDGNASYRHLVMPGPSAHYVGLWGVDTVELPQHADTDLTNPYVAATTALELSDMRQGFGWCPAWRSGAYASYLERGTAVASRMPAREAEHVPLLTEQLPPLMHAHHIALQPALARLGHVAERRR